MLSIASAGAGHGEYYLNLAHGDYYLEAGEPPGRWHGRGAERLGLSGVVSRSHFQSLLAGELPDGRLAVQRQADKARKSGYDLTFNCPKSVSALWAVGGRELRDTIERLVDESVDEALRFLEDTSAFSRRGQGGLRHERSDLVFAKFEHGSSRNLDPHLHVHVFLLNVCLREDGTTGAVYGPALFRAKMAAGALFRAELAARLERELGLSISRDGSSFAIDGVPKELASLWSSRRHEIEEVLARRGHSSAKAAEVAALDTRGRKAILPRKELYARWEAEALALGFTAETARALFREPPCRDRIAEAANAAGRALSRITTSQSHFSERDLLRFAAEEAQGHGVDAAEVRAAVVAHLLRSKEIVRLGFHHGELRYTTTEILELEQRLLTLVEESKRVASHVLSRETIEEVLSERSTMTSEQAEALQHLTLSGGSIRVVTGMAGSGKTFLLSGVREAFEREGFEVLGAALAGKAARGLEGGAGIRSSTVHALLKAAGDGTLSLGPRSVLVLDEAGMVGTRQMEAVVRLVAESGSLLLCVGDARQLQPIEHGGPFAAMGRALGEARLETIVRQVEGWAREAVKDIAAGRAGEALREFARRGLLVVEEEREDALRSLVRSWSEVGLDSPESALIFASSNREVGELNRLAQAERRAASRLGAESVVVGADVVFVGDRILFTRNARSFGVCNGDLGTALGVHEPTRTLIARLDSGRTVAVPLESYDHLRLGYAVTTHKGQGVTCDRAFVLVGGDGQDLHAAYVQASRARVETKLFTDRLSAGDELADLVRAMERDRQKDLAHDLLPEPHLLSVGAA